MQVLYLILTAIGALASTAFVGAYLRTADLSQAIARVLLTLNISLAGVLWIVSINQFAPLNDSLFWRYIYLTLFMGIDIALVYQFILLLKAQHDDDEGNDGSRNW